MFCVGQRVRHSDNPEETLGTIRYVDSEFPCAVVRWDDGKGTMGGDRMGPEEIDLYDFEQLEPAD